MPTVASVIVSMLESAGVDRAFCVSGESYLALLNELESRATIDVVTCRQEGGAGMMAVADAKLTGRPGVCMVSRGPGAANAAIGVLAAQQDTVPLLLLVGQVESTLLRRDAFQEVDYSKFFSGTAKWTAELNDPRRVHDVMSRALHIAQSGTPGPVVIALPEDILALEADMAQAPVWRPSRDSVDQSTLEEIAALVRKAERPLIIAGGDVANPAARAALYAAAMAWQIPVLCSFRRYDLFPNAHPLFAGELGFFNKPHHIARYHESDLVISVGTRLGDLTTQGYTFPRSPNPAQPLVHVYRDPAMIGVNFTPDIGVVCSAERFLRAFADMHPKAGPDRSRWILELGRFRAEIAELQRAEAPDGVAFGNVVLEMGQYVKPDAIVSMDAGISAAMLYRHYNWTPPQLLLTPIAGTMGWGIPGAVAAALRFPDRQIICMIGDGGLLMGGMELAVAAERKLPITIILANNKSYGAIRLNLEREYPGRQTATVLHNPDFQQLSAAFGCKTYQIINDDEIASVLASAFSTRALTLVEVRTSLQVALAKLQPAAVVSDASV